MYISNKFRAIQRWNLSNQHTILKYLMSNCEGVQLLQCDNTTASSFTKNWIFSHIFFKYFEHSCRRPFVGCFLRLKKICFILLGSSFKILVLRWAEIIQVHEYPVYIKAILVHVCFGQFSWPVICLIQNDDTFYWYDYTLLLSVLSVTLV